jgi:drug/metabolite transporter (DMT)-like permease
MYKQSFMRLGVSAALGSALLFGAGTPLAKLLLANVGPWTLAGLFYLGSGFGLLIYRLIVRSSPVVLAQGDLKWLAGATLVGGVIGPLLLMLGLTGMPASGASLLLNAEGVFTALLAWVAFRENFDKRIALGMACITLGAVVLTLSIEVSFAGLWPALSILGACFAWGVDNNLTRKVSLIDATWIASVKGLVAGSVNFGLALLLEDHLPALFIFCSAMLVGFFTYGVSLALFVVGLRHLGTARTGAYFSVAPFFGVALALAIGEPITWQLTLAGGLMGVGIWLHLSEHHSHAHTHDAMEHEHEHLHDIHHEHSHYDQSEISFGNKLSHSHNHKHLPMSHTHEHFPDAHHRHDH